MTNYHRVLKSWRWHHTGIITNLLAGSTICHTSVIYLLYHPLIGASIEIEFQSQIQKTLQSGSYFCAYTPHKSHFLKHIHTQKKISKVATPHFFPPFSNQQEFQANKRTRKICASLQELSCVSHQGAGEIGDSPALTKAEAAWRMRLAKTVEPAKASGSDGKFRIGWLQLSLKCQVFLGGGAGNFFEQILSESTSSHKKSRHNLWRRLSWVDSVYYNKTQDFENKNRSRKLGKKFGGNFRVPKNPLKSL